VAVLKRTNIYLADADKAALRVIREAHGLATDASAVRFAIREAARAVGRRAAQVTRRRGSPRPGPNARAEGDPDGVERLRRYDAAPSP
jgi:hypothetical protein